MRAGRLAVMALVTMTAGGCRSDGERAHDDRLVDSYEQVLRAAIAPGGGLETTVTAGSRPVVYAVGMDGASIDPEIQAEVAKRVVEDVDLRFADERDEAFDLDDAGDPVRDGGLLIELGALPDGDAERYVVDAAWARARDERHEVQVHMRARGDDVTITSTALAD